MPSKVNGPNALAMYRLVASPRSRLVIIPRVAGGNCSISTAEAAEAMTSAPVTSWFP